MARDEMRRQDPNWLIQVEEEELDCSICSESKKVSLFANITENNETIARYVFNTDVRLSSNVNHGGTLYTLARALALPRPILLIMHMIANSFLMK